MRRPVVGGRLCVCCCCGQDAAEGGQAGVTGQRRSRGRALWGDLGSGRSRGCGCGVGGNGSQRRRPTSERDRQAFSRARRNGPFLAHRTATGIRPSYCSHYSTRKLARPRRHNPTRLNSPTLSTPIVCEVCPADSAQPVSTVLPRPWAASAVCLIPRPCRRVHLSRHLRVARSQPPDTASTRAVAATVAATSWFRATPGQAMARAGNRQPLDCCKRRRMHMPTARASAEKGLQLWLLHCPVCGAVPTVALYWLLWPY